MNSPDPIPEVAGSRRDFLKRSLGLVAAVSPLGRAAAIAASQQERPRAVVMAYVATFTPGTHFAEPYNTAPGNGLGIHIFQLDSSSGALSPRGVFAANSSPNCLAANRAGTRLYSTNKGSGAPDSGEVSAYAVDPATGALTLLNSVGSGAVGPAHLSVHPAERHVLVADYAGGAVAVLPIRENGDLGPATEVQRLHGLVGPSAATNAAKGSFAISGHDAPHGHMIQADPSGRFVLAADLGTDRIMIWKFDVNSGTLAPNDPPFVNVPAGDGPRHFVFHPNGRWFYSLQEEAPTVILWDYDASSGRLSARQTVSSLPPGFAGTCFPSGIAVSADGRFVYAANRLHDSLSAFAVSSDGTLSLASNTWTRGDYPRDIAVDPSGAFLFSCNQRSDAVTGFRVDRQTGNLAFTGQYTAVGSPSMMLFLELSQAVGS